MLIKKIEGNREEPQTHISGDREEYQKLQEELRQLKYEYDKNLNELAKLLVDHKVMERVKQHNEITSTGRMLDLEQENQKLHAENEELKKARKVAITLRNVFWDKEGGKALLELPDGNLEEPSQKFTLKINDMITPKLKEWKDF